jgi:hypothetical protein
VGTLLDILLASENSHVSRVHPGTQLTTHKRASTRTQFKLLPSTLERWHNLLLLFTLLILTSSTPESPKRRILKAKDPSLALPHHKLNILKNKPTSTKIMDNSNPQTSSDQHEKVCIIGSGNWGSAISTLVGRNCARLQKCETDVNMWVYEEEVETEDGSIQKLTDVINTQHENVKYLPGIKLPENIKAVPDLAEACDGATLLIFVLPHQFLPKLLPTIREAAHPSCRGVSLIKGLGTFVVVA